jgi:hypothetical protein
VPISIQAADRDSPEISPPDQAVAQLFSGGLILSEDRELR